MENEDIKFGGSIKLNEYKKLNHYARRKLFVILHVAYFIVMFFVWLILVGGILGSTIFALIFTLILFTVIQIVVPFQIRGEYKSNQLLRSDVQYVVNRSGITQTRGVSKVFLDWNDFRSAFEYKDMFRILI
ncbi:hypothetical protein [Sporolactobacillus vineae]|uniref:hypothetical protein n=1 Tax=Sporolactobacillus vineae TaxID=444463 RepID=UPI000289E515|nr:hypothetical protein [Sporolactobacillus vineae]